MNKRLVCAMALAVAGGVLGGCATPSQMIADHKMDELCAKDGGAMVYEKIYLEPNELAEVLRRNRVVDGAHDLGFGFLLTNKTTRVYDSGGSATVTKIQSQIFSHSRLIAQNNFYRRRGGDFPLSTSMPESNSCPRNHGFFLDQVFQTKTSDNGGEK